MNTDSFIEPKYSTIERAAEILKITTDNVISLIEQGELLAYAAIPSTPMVFTPEEDDKTISMLFSNPELHSDELEKLTICKAGIFRIKDNDAKSVAINGSALINEVITTTPIDEGMVFREQTTTKIDIDKDINRNNYSKEEQIILDDIIFEMKIIEEMSKSLKKRIIIHSERYRLVQPIKIALSNIRISYFFIKNINKLRGIIETIESMKEQHPKEKPLHASEQNTIQDSEPDSYHTQAIDALRAAISQFWLNYDPSRPPKSPEIVEWLMREHKMTQTMAESIDRVIRPEELRKGGNTKLS